MLHISVRFLQGLFRIAAGASKLKKLKAALDCSTSQLEEFYSDPHAVAGMFCFQFKKNIYTSNILVYVDAIHFI